MKSEAKFRLADSTIVEPLVNQWFAWSSTIAPVPASLHLMQYQLPLMESYLSAPELHQEVSQTPEFIAGSYINISPENKNSLGRLLNDSKIALRLNIRMAEDIFEFYNYLVREAHGQSLESFYRRVPDSLRGLVELSYDYYHRPSVRFLESLIYQSDYYREDLQSLRFSPNAGDGMRKYFLNTPRIHQPDQIDWAIPFKNPRVDQLFELSTTPQPLDFIRELLQISENFTDRQLAELFSPDPVRHQEKWNEHRIRYKYFGHACVLLEYRGTSILVDPFIPLIPLDGGRDRFSYGDLPASIDYVLITHNHQDHFNLECLLRLRSRIGCLVVPRSFGALYGDISLKLMAQTLGFRHVVEVDSFDSIDITDGEITAIPFFGEHSDILHAKTGYVVRTGKRRTLFAADSDCLEKEVYARVVKYLGRIDTAFLGMESEGAPLSFGYGSLFPRKVEREYDEARRQRGCNADRGLDILQTIGADRIYNYAMGLEPWTRYILGLELSQDSPCKDEFIAENEPDEGGFVSVPVNIAESGRDEEGQFHFD